MDRQAITIGHISANIAGDARYTDRLTLTYDPTSRVVTCEVRTTGGMDGPGGADPSRLEMSQSTVADPTPKQVMDLVNAALSRNDFSFKRYGTPSKRFTWNTLDGDKRGLSLALAKAALACARWEPEVLDERYD